MKTWQKLGILGALAAMAATNTFAQFGGRGYGRGDEGTFVRTEGGQMVNTDTVRTARETPTMGDAPPAWTNAPGFEKHVFTFARLVFRSIGRPASNGWMNDYPDSDLNLSFRLQQLTSMKVDPDARVLHIMDPALKDYPFVFIAHPGAISLPDEEVEVLRKYLLNGGVLMADDFWSGPEWDHFESEIARVLPGKSWVELPIEHPLFHCVFNLKGTMNDLQIPSIHWWRRNNGTATGPGSRVSRGRGPDSDNMHVRAWLDDKKRIMLLAFHNTDNGDGWEREAENEDFFHLFSEPRAYPLAINTIFYLMTH